MHDYTLPSLLLLLSLATSACGGDDDTSFEPLFPEDYATSYVEVRDCRTSSEHDLNKIRVLADPASSQAYLDRMEEFPVGAVLLKEEYDFADEDCSGDIKQWTVMVRMPTDSSPDTLDWTWQEVGVAGNVESEDSPGCINCHASCVPPGGYFNTCTEENPGG